LIPLYLTIPEEKDTNTERICLGRIALEIAMSYYILLYEENKKGKLNVDQFFMKKELPTQLSI
jgi:hypothetical protein